VVLAQLSAKLKLKEARVRLPAGQKHPSIRKKDDHSWKVVSARKSAKLKEAHPNIHPSEKHDPSWKEKLILSKTIGILSALLKSKSIDDIIDYNAQEFRKR